MAEETKDSTTPESKTYTQEEVERMIKGRGKKMEQEIAQLKMQNEALNAQPVQPQAMPPQAQSAPMMQGGQMAQQPVPQPQMPENAQSGAPLTAEAMQQILDQYTQQQQTEERVRNARAHAVNQIQNLMADDQDFADLLSKKTDNKIPEEVWISMMNRFNPKVAKGVMKSVLTNPYEYEVMKNHLLEGKFEHWLGQRMNGSPQSENPGMPSPPDLSGDSIKGDGSPAYESAIDNYMKNSY